MADAMDRLVEQLSEKLQEKLMERVMQRAQEKLAANLGAPAPTEVSAPRRGRKPSKSKTDDKAIKSCPKCGESKPVGTGFGLKPVHLVSGTIMKPQSWCRECRAKGVQKR